VWWGGGRQAVAAVAATAVAVAVTAAGGGAQPLLKIGPKTFPGAIGTEFLNSGLSYSIDWA